VLDAVGRLRQMVDGSDADEDHKRFERQKLDALLGWCEVTDCRRRPLLTYFGDTYAGECGNCDNCLNPPATWDGTEAARKLLSAVYRTGQRFGAGHVVDVLLGNATQKASQNRHDELSVFGIGAELGAQPWRSVIRQLIVQGYLKADQRRYGALMLTAQSRALLKGEVQLQLREDTKLVAPRKKARRVATAVTEADRPLFEALRQCRKQLAGEQNLPAYVIFHDGTLMQMAGQRPTTPGELLRINGVGEAKLARYGELFLDIIRSASNKEWQSPAEIPAHACGQIPASE
jgi:ATP-dependent DNA helicase RecQ